MTDTTPPAGAASKWWRRRWVQLVGVGVLGVAIGGAGAGAGGNSHAKELSALRADKISLIAQVDAAMARLNDDEQQVADMNSQVSNAEDAAANAAAVAKQQVQAQNAATAAKLRAQAAALTARGKALDARERVVKGEEQSYADNTISGDGTYVVGTDIQPGVYHASAMAGCYWSRLRSLSTSDIIDNDNADGPVTVQIYSSDRAFYVSGCDDFHKVG